MWHPEIDLGSNMQFVAETGVTIVPTDSLSTMALVRLPEGLSGQASQERKTSDDAKVIQDYLFSQRIEVPIKCVNGILYVRISCFVYNEDWEYERLGHAFLNISVQ